MVNSDGAESILNTGGTATSKPFPNWPGQWHGTCSMHRNFVCRMSVAHGRVLEVIL